MCAVIQSSIEAVRVEISENFRYMRSNMESLVMSVSESERMDNTLNSRLENVGVSLNVATDTHHRLLVHISPWQDIKCASFKPFTAIPN